MSEFFADPYKFYADHPGWLFVTATLLPLLSFVLIFLASGAWALLRRYRDDHPGRRTGSIYLFGGDKGGRGAAYVATAAIGLAFLLSLAGFVVFTFVDGDQEAARDRHESEIKELREKLVAGKGDRKEVEQRPANGGRGAGGAGRPLGRPFRLAAHPPRHHRRPAARHGPATRLPHRQPGRPDVPDGDVHRHADSHVLHRLHGR